MVIYEYNLSFSVSLSLTPYSCPLYKHNFTNDYLSVLLEFRLEISLTVMQMSGHSMPQFPLTSNLDIIISNNTSSVSVDDGLIIQQQLGVTNENPVNLFLFYIRAIRNVLLSFSVLFIFFKFYYFKFFSSHDSCHFERLAISAIRSGEYRANIPKNCRSN